MSRLSPEDKAELHYYQEKDEQLLEARLALKQEDGWHVLPGSGFPRVWEGRPIEEMDLKGEEVARKSVAVVLCLGTVPFGGSRATVYAFRIFDPGAKIVVPTLAQWAIQNNRGSREEYEASEEASGLVWRKKEW